MQKKVHNNRAFFQGQDGLRNVLALEVLEGFVPIELRATLPFGSDDVPGRRFDLGVWSGARAGDQQVLWTVSVNARLYQMQLTYDGPYTGLIAADAPKLQDVEIYSEKRSVLKVSLHEDGLATFQNNEGWLYELPVGEAGTRTVTNKMVANIHPDLLVLLDGNLHRALASWFSGAKPGDASPRILPIVIAIALCCVSVDVGHSGKKDESVHWEVSLNCHCLDDDEGKLYRLA